MKSKYSKVLIIPYFGTFPNYFNLWLASCAYNKDYNFYIYTDIDTSCILHSDNVKFISCTLDEIRKKAENVMGFKVSLDRPYKLCDYKPCYGAIFYEDIKSFDFWGYCDIDLIFGDISHFLTDDLFDNFDKKIAINGTTKIIDDNFGIPNKIYKITVKFLNEESRDKFIKNMFDNGKINPNITITRSLSELKEELISIQNIELSQELNYDLAIISKDDKIIPTKNQLNFWQNKTKIKEINSTHCPFEIYNSWQDLLC